MEKQDLQKAYNQYIEELAKNALDNKPINETLLNIVANVQNKMRDLDIVEAMNRLKGNTIPKTTSDTLDTSILGGEAPQPQNQNNNLYTHNEFGEIISDNEEEHSHLR